MKPEELKPDIGFPTSEPKPMFIQEALTLAKEQGKKVRPVCWKDAAGLHVEFAVINPAWSEGTFVVVWDKGRRLAEFHGVPMLLGPWEVVE